MIKNFTDYIEESYLDSNHAPLYHICGIHSLYDILKDNILKKGYFENPLNGEFLHMVSLTRYKKLNLNYYKEFCECIIELDKNKLSQNYKIYKYDFFIHAKQEDKPKSNINRNKPIEFEEMILNDILNIDKYILSIDFINNSLSIISNELLSLLTMKNIKILNNGK